MINRWLLYDGDYTHTCNKNKRREETLGAVGTHPGDHLWTKGFVLFCFFLKREMETEVEYKPSISWLWVSSPFKASIMED